MINTLVHIVILHASVVVVSIGHHSLIKMVTINVCGNKI